MHADRFPLRRGRTPNEVTAKYNRHERYRRLVKAHIAAGSVNREKLIRVLLMDPIDGSSEEVRAVQSILDNSVIRSTR